jgi:hypothetical protein
MHRLLIALALLHAALMPCAMGKAEPTAGEPSEYRATINTAIGEFDQGNYEEAREHFARAHALLPNARTLRGLGMSEFELRNYIEAVRNLTEALASGQKPLRGALRDETLALLKRAQKYVGEVVVQVSPNATVVRVDGIPVELTERRQIQLEVGDHVLEFVAEGYLTERRALKIRGEQSIELSVTLAAAQVSSVPGPSLREEKGRGDVATANEVRASTPVYKRWWLWTSVGAVVVGGVVAGALLARRPKEVEDSNGGTTGDVFTVK